MAAWTADLMRLVVQGRPRPMLSHWHLHLPEGIADLERDQEDRAAYPPGSTALTLTDCLRCVPPGHRARMPLSELVTSLATAETFPPSLSNQVPAAQPTSPTGGTP